MRGECARSVSSVVAPVSEAGLPVRTLPMTASTKTDAFLELRARLNRGSLELYPDHYSQIFARAHWVGATPFLPCATPLSAIRQRPRLTFRLCARLTSRRSKPGSG